MKKILLLIALTLCTNRVVNAQDFNHSPDKKFKELSGKWKMDKTKSERYNGELEIIEIEFVKNDSAFTEFVSIFKNSQKHPEKDSVFVDVLFAAKGSIMFSNIDKREVFKRKLYFAIFNTHKAKAFLFSDFERKDKFESLVCSFYMIDKKSFVLIEQDFGAFYFSKK